MTRTKFTPETGKLYRNGTDEYVCITAYNTNAVLRSTSSGWTLTAHGCGIYDDGSIDWDYSTDGHFDIGWR